jgi:hypothetical protein
MIAAIYARKSADQGCGPRSRAQDFHFRDLRHDGATRL